MMMNGGGVSAMDEGAEEIKSPIKRLGSTRKLMLFNNIRLQLNEQLRCLDVRVESQISLIQELQDFFRRRGEVELDYSKSLDKLAKSLQLRHKEQKQKREQWPMFSSYACWHQLVNQTKTLSKDHAALSEIYSTHLVARLQTVCEDVQRIYRRCREIGYETHEEILKVLQELHTTMKTYHNYQNECKDAEKKLRTAEQQRTKFQHTIPKEKLERSKKYRLIEKEVLKRKNKYTDARLKSLKAKNEYQLCLEASNTTIHKYFVEDLSDLIDCMDLGFHSVVSRALLLHVSADQGRCRAVLSNADTLSRIISSMDSRADKQKFLEQHHGAFMIPKRLEFQGQHDEVEPELQKALHQEMELRLSHLEQRVNTLRTESEEIWKTLETAEINLLDILNTKDYDCSSIFGEHAQFIKPEGMTQKLRSDKQDIEEFYITKIRGYIMCTSRIARLDSKAEFLRNALTKDSSIPANVLIKSNVPKRKRIGRMNMSGRPKLFGGSLEEYLETTGEDIPLVIRSCIRVINLYGLHHQGIFRVSGSQLEISNFREGFERGEDPLADTTDASDINSVAGLLKLYLRELREPLFPIIYFDHFITLAQLESKHEVVLGIKKFLLNLPRSVVIVIRYIFAFLNHLSEYSDENMMDAYNLAICFGPTLMPAPEDKDQVQYQNQVNELIKNMIVHHEELFAKDLGGFAYEKYISQEPFEDIDVGDSPTEQATEDPDSEVYPSEDESDTFEATVQFDFNARSDRELSLRKGDNVTLFNQVSNDWWRGTVKGKTGLVPDKYISLKIKDEDRDKTSEHLKSSSSEESVRKRRPSGNISINSQLSICTQNSNTTCGSDYTVSGSTITQPAAQSLQHSPQIQPIVMKANVQQQPLSITENNIDVQDKSPDYIHYDSVDNIKTTSAYNYHDEPHSFENSMDFSDNHFTFENRKPEPIYAEPTKVIHHVKIDTDDDENVILRTKLNEDGIKTVESGAKLSVFSNRKSDTIDCDAADPNELSDGERNRHSDTEILREQMQENVSGDMRPTRKYHSKSFSLSENRILGGIGLGVSGSVTSATGTNVFQQNRSLWQKRAELSSQQNLSTQRILSRNRLAPDLVMDLPLSANADCPVRASHESLDVELEDMTSAERFAAQNQCTLKKNERFAPETQTTFEIKKEVKLDFKGTDKPKAEVKPQETTTGGTTIATLSTTTTTTLDLDSNTVMEDSLLSVTDTSKKSDNLQVHLIDDVLHIDEAADSTDSFPPTSTKNIHKSPIPTRNTQKYVSQFADLHLTGGCMNAPETKHSNPSVVASNQQSSTFNMSSFKPQVKVKPQILKKPLVLPPQTPEMNRKNTNQD